MKLSEAIRLGAAMTPQCRFFLISSGRTCAIGAAALAIGAISLDRTSSELSPFVAVNSFPGLGKLTRVPSLGAPNSLRYSVETVITALNDTFLWTREQIAQWLVDSGNDCEAALPATEEALPERDAVWESATSK